MTKQPHSKPALHFAGLSRFNQLLLILGVGFGTGLAPRAPGTVASLAVLVLLPLWISLGFFASVIGIALMSVAGIFICERTASLMQVHDDARIVWDEFAGQSIALLPCLYLMQGLQGHNTLEVIQAQGYSVLAALVLFRVFDIKKPWPIGYVDRQVAGGLGIMLDDILAGIMAAIVLCAGLAIFA